MTSVDRQEYSLPTTIPKLFMAIKTPPGYVTRSKAEKIYNRSKRSLERDLEIAQKENDIEVLSAFKLVANDHDPQDAHLVTTEMVESLKQDGKNPAWCINTIWLESKFGRKGSSKPEPSIETEPPAPSAEKIQPVHARVAPTPTQPIPAKTNNPISIDVEFLKERIRVLEKEKQQEIDRNQERERELFSQLAVKDKQISSWDELTQGLARGLATGQLKPAPEAPVPVQSSNRTNVSVVNSDVSAPKTKDITGVSSAKSNRSKEVKKRNAKTTAVKSNSKTNVSRKKAASSKSKASISPKKRATKKNVVKKTEKVVASSKTKQAAKKPKGLIGRLFAIRNNQ